MSVKTRIYLPSDVRGLDIALATAILAGLPVSLTNLECIVNGLETGTFMMMGANFTLKGSMVDGTGAHRFCICYESDEYPGHSREISVPSTAFWVAIGRRLISFYGGALLFSDSKGDEADEYRIRKWSYPRESDDSACTELSARIAALQPISRAELNAAAKVSYYGNGAHC